MPAMPVVGQVVDLGERRRARPGRTRSDGVGAPCRAPIGHRPRLPANLTRGQPDSRMRGPRGRGSGAGEAWRGGGRPHRRPVRSAGAAGDGRRPGAEAGGRDPAPDPAAPWAPGGVAARHGTPPTEMMPHRRLDKGWLRRTVRQTRAASAILRTLPVTPRPGRGGEGGDETIVLERRRRSSGRARRAPWDAVSRPRRSASSRPPGSAARPSSTPTSTPRPSTTAT